MLDSSLNSNWTKYRDAGKSKLKVGDTTVPAATEQVTNCRKTKD